VYEGLSERLGVWNGLDPCDRSHFGYRPADAISVPHHFTGGKIILLDLGEKKCRKSVMLNIRGET